MERTILHCDLNNFYASCECMIDTSLKDKPVAVCGSVELRHGIVLAKNYIAKNFGVETAEPVWQAKAKCPGLIIVEPHFELYSEYSQRVKKIYTEYTDRVESFGLDECWLDISGSKIGDAESLEIANEIRERVKKETGLTISVGVSFNKVFAKLGSDLKKPDAVTLISKKEFKEKIWDIPAYFMFGVGRKTAKILSKYRIETIGDIAMLPKDFFESRMGKIGVKLWEFANGEDHSEVLPAEADVPAKSFGHGITTPKDLTSRDSVWRVLLFLAQDIGHSLYFSHQRACGVSVAVKDNQLTNKQWQCILPMPTASPLNLAREAFKLFVSFYEWKNPIRSVTITAINLISEYTPHQINMFEDTSSFEKAEKIDECAERIRRIFGRDAILPASLLGSGVDVTEAVNPFGRGR